jgi:hypothetical protein
MRRLSAWLALAAWCAVIFAFSARPGSGGRDLGWAFVAKGAHLFEYGVLFLLARRVLPGDGKALLFCLAYAASDEWHQSFVPGRGPSPVDVLIDGLGALTAARRRAILEG